MYNLEIMALCMLYVVEICNPLFLVNSIFDKCLSPRQTTANDCKTAFSLHVVESASDDCNF